MKKRKLFAMLFAVLGVGILSAQTDVTDQYLTNADFEGEYSRFFDINTDRGVEKPLGWSVEWYQDNNDKNGMTYVAESMNQDNITWSGKSGKSYFARMRWGNATLYLRQTLQNLRPGDYTLSFLVAGHTTNAANTVQVSVAGQTQSITLSDNANGNWTDYSIDFSITETTPYATVEFKAVREGDLLKIGVDEFKLMYDGSSYYESIISKAQALYDNNKDWAENGLADFETAISGNKEKQTIAEKNEAIVALENAMATFKKLNSVDVTVKINNPNFDSNIDGWTLTGGDGDPFKRQTSTQPNFAGGFLEKWRNAWTGAYNQKDFDVSQEISNLPSGEYTVGAYIQAQMQGEKETLGNDYKNKKHGGPYYIDDEKGVWMYATSGDNSSNVWANTHNPNFGETGGGVLRTATVEVTNGLLKIGFKGIGSPNGGTELGTYANWIACDTWTLSYFGFDPTTLLAQLELLKDEAESLLENEEYKTVIGAERTALINVIELTPEETKNGLETAIAQLESLTNAFKAATSDYATLATEKEIATGLGMSEESIASITATTKTGLAALQDLKVAEYNYIQSTYTESATLGSWTEDFAEDLSGEGYKADGPTYFNEWGSATRTAKQTVTLPAGDYAISSIGRGQPGTSGHLYYKLGETTNKVNFIMKNNRGRGVDVNGVANFSEEGTYNKNGEGFGWEYRFITFHLDAETEVEIGVSATFASAWVSIYAPVLLTTEASVKALRMTEITNLVSNVPTEKMDATVESTLNSKKAAAEAASAEDNTVDELTTIAAELNEAIKNAKSSIEDYSTIKTYIDKANSIGESIAATYQEQYNNGTITESTDTIFQNLEVATYNYVTQKFNYAVPISSTWNSTGTNTSAAEFNNEHWSGEIRPYMNQKDGENLGYNANQWSLDFDQEVVLPAGEYVFKVAGRKSANATLQLVVTKKDTLGIVSDFPNGSTGRGINKAGEASFNPNDQFTRDDNTGFGWQWRYVRFVLDAEDTVKIAVHAETNKKSNWVSFGDYTLQMTEATYLEANKGGLDTPTAEAEALVDTPMGNAENQALKSALAMTYTTGAELLAKIEALETAVANAKASAATYKQIATYIAKANTINESIAATYQEQYNNGTITESTDTIFQNLEVATYNYVTENFNYAVPISNTWNSTGTNTTAKEFSNEHWSGETRGYMNQNDDNGQGWNANAWSLDFDQDVTLPAGEYVFKVAGRKSADATLELVVTMGETTLGTVSDFPNGSTGRGINKAGEASFNPNDQFTRDDNTGFGWQWRYVRFVLDAEDTVKIAVHAETNKKYNWVSFGDYTLQMTEATYLEANKGALDVPTAEAEALVDTVPMGNTENQALKSALAMTYNTGAELLAKIEALETAVANAKASAAAYKQIAVYIAKANAINESIAATYQEQFNNGTITESTDTIFQNLEVATYNYVTEVFNYPVELPAGDWISEGPTGSKNEKHWSGESRSYLEQSSNAWGQNAWTITYKQDKTLPAGDYVFKVAGRRAPGTGNTMSLEVVNINDSVNPVKLGLVNDFPEGDSGLGINKAGEASFDANDTIVGFANNNAGFGWQWRYVKFTLTDETKVQVAVKAEATTNHQWVGFCDATLQMTEATYMEANKGALDIPTAEAEAMVDSVVMGNAENQALKSALAMTYTTGAELLAKIEALETAVANAKASAAVYKEIAPYIVKANAIDASIAADYKTQYDNRAIEDDDKTIFENLEVATYNYVTTNFTYAVKLSDTWNSTGTNTKAATFSNEHWSGEVREYKNQDDSNGQGWNASAWSLDFDQEVTLPAGEYIFKVAGRKSADATLQLVVTKGEETLGTVEDFPVSSKARGINKAGATSFDANDTIVGFANNGEGYGWQWRYVRFVLDAEDTVKIAVHAETNKKYNWVSFGDYTLQMTEETYLEANKGGLDAPTAEAEKLVADTIMGDTVRTALKNALAMTYTTGAELLAKIEALETAVANAKAWVKAYNEAKAQLVAALERFEADYNDGENGAKQYMAKSRWATVVTMAQEAAVAKDVTNSYAGFSVATKNLVSALDSADVSIKEYAALNEAIKNAEAIIASKVNWGDKPFQRPTSAKEGLNTTTAQGVYDAAEADGEGVTSVTTALTKAIAAANQLNAPEEGDAYYMTVAVAGHAYESYPVVASLGTPGNNNPTGYVFTAKTKEANACKLFTFTQVEGNNYNISFKMDSVIVYLTYGSLNGSAAGWNKQQIQATTVAENKGTFAIEASTITEGAIKIRNTVTGNYLDCEDGGSIYTNDDITKDEFGIIAQGTILSDSINIPYENKFATRVLMFDAVLPEGLKAYKYSSIENDCLILQEIEGTVPAYTPCLLHAEYGFEGTLEGTIVMDGYSATVTKDNILHGAIKQYSITEGYTLQKEEGADVAFYAVGNEQEVVIPAGECWLSVIKDIAAETIYLTIAEGGTVGIDKAQIDLSILNGAIYTLDGKKVNSMLPGQIYIINGKKVMVK